MLIFVRDGGVGLTVRLCRWIDGVSILSKRISSKLGASRHGPKRSPTTVQFSGQFHKVVIIIGRDIE